MEATTNITIDVSSPSWKIRTYQYFSSVMMGLCGALLAAMLIDSIRLGEGLFIAAFACVIALYIPYYIRRVHRVATGRRHVPLRAQLAGNSLTVETQSGAKTIDLSQVIVTVGYSSISCVALLFVLPEDYLVLNVCTGLTFLEEGRDPIRNFYRIVQYCKAHTPHFENVVRSRKARRHPWIRVPALVLEWDVRSERVEKLVKKIRKHYS